MSRDIGMTPNPQSGLGVVGCRGLVAGGPSGFSGGLVVAVGVEDKVAEQFAGGGVDDPDLEVLDEEQDVGSGVGSPDADVMESAGVAEGELAGGVDAVAADPVVAIGVA